MAEYLTIACSDKASDLMVDKNGNLVMATGKLALSYITQNAIRTVRGELPFDTDYGVPYFTTIFASPPNLPMWEYYVKDTALTVPGVISVASFRSDIVDVPISANCNLPTKAVKYEMVIVTDDGDITLTGGGGNVVEGDLDAIMLTEEEPRSISIVAPYEWLDGNGNRIYSTKRDISQGDFLYAQTNIQAQLLAGETEDAARKRLSQSEVSDVFYGNYIITGELLGGTYSYWRQDSGDVVLNAGTITTVQMQDNPRGLAPAPENAIWREVGGSVVIGGTVGRIFSDACDTDNPDADQLSQFNADALTISGGTETWQTPYLIIGNYSAHGEDNEMPYLALTGNTVQIWTWDDENKVYTTYNEMTQFSGATFEVTAWVPSSYIAQSSTTQTSVPASTPIQDEENGGYTNTDFTTIRGGTGQTCFGYGGIWWKSGGASSPFGYVFGGGTTAQMWTSLNGGTSVYTASVSTVSVCYDNAQLTGGTTAIVAYGYGPSIVLTSGGGTFHNPL